MTQFGTELSTLPVVMLYVCLCTVFVTRCRDRLGEHRINHVLFSGVCRLVRDIQLSNKRANQFCIK